MHNQSATGLLKVHIRLSNSLISIRVETGY